MPPIREKKQKSVFWQVFFGVITALITLHILGILLGLGLLASFMNMVGNAINTHNQTSATTQTVIQQPQTSTLQITPSPKTATQHHYQNRIVINTTTKQITHSNNEPDLPPWEYPGQWAQLKGTDRPCWVHVKTAKKVCQ